MNATIRSTDLDTDESGYPVHTDFGIKCGNHGRQKVYHTNIATVKFCFDLRRDQEAQQAAEIAAEQAIERHFEERGYDEARAQEDWEARNGVVDFATARAQAEEMWPWADGQRPGQEPATEQRNNDWGKWSSADRERAQFERSRPARVTQDGMYRNPETNEIWKVQVAVHGSGQLYAKLLERLDAPKIKRGKKYSYDFRYVPGGIKTLRPEWRMTLAEAQEYGRLYGCCIRCGAVLTKEESIARAMGDTCASKGNWA